MQRPDLVFDSNPSRALTSVNVRRDDKDVFDILQAYWTIRKGRALTQWETFTVVLAESLDRHGPELQSLGLVQGKGP